MLINLRIWNKKNTVYISCILKVKIYLFICKHVVSLQIFFTLIYLHEFSRFSPVRTVVAKKDICKKINFSSAIAIIVQGLCYNMDAAQLSVFCVSSCRHFVRIALNEVQEQQVMLLVIISFLELYFCRLLPSCFYAFMRGSCIIMLLSLVSP